MRRRHFIAGLGSAAAARTLGIDVPLPLLASADEVIE
jgi:hypothetical protein